MWEKFQLHEQFEIVLQSSDPDFAQLSNRVRECQQTDNDVIQIKALANADTATWPDIETNTCSISIPYNIGLSLSNYQPTCKIDDEIHYVLVQE